MANIINKTLKILTNNVVYFRVKNNWSQEYLAELLKTTPSYVSDIENAKRNLSVEYIDKLANVFNIEPHELLIERLPVNIRRIKKHKR